MSVKAAISFRLPASLNVDEVLDDLFSAQSGLTQIGERTERTDELNFELDTLFTCVAAVLSSLQAGAALAELARKIARRRRATARANAIEAEIHIVVDGVRYEISGMTPEEIARLLEP